MLCMKWRTARMRERWKMVPTRFLFLSCTWQMRAPIPWRISVLTIMPDWLSREMRRSCTWIIQRSPILIWLHTWQKCGFTEKTWPWWVLIPQERWYRLLFTPTTRIWTEAFLWTLPTRVLSTIILNQDMWSWWVIRQNGLPGSRYLSWMKSAAETSHRMHGWLWIGKMQKRFPMTRRMNR